VSDRQKFHIDTRAQKIIDMVIRKQQELFKDRDNQKRRRKPEDSDNDTIPWDQMLSTPQLAVLFGVSEIWLETLRQRKQGPKYVVLGPRCVRYKMNDVLSWLKSRARCAR
jgi:predicted DNA-binding transcriptional regulator AlpA